MVHFLSIPTSSYTPRYKKHFVPLISTRGGLYIPETIPEFSLQEILEWKGTSFPAIAFQIFRRFIDVKEIPSDDLFSLLEKSFTAFTHPDITPLVKLPVHSTQLKNCWILELFHGPTFAFKDVALQVVGNLFEYFLLKKNANVLPNEKPFRITVLGATSGDTGGAAIYGLKGKKNIDCFILHPKDRISSVQYDQMTSCIEMNVHNIAVEGTFDDCQDIVKELFTDLEFKRRYNLAAINSINWARILSQTVYYFHSYLSCADKSSGLLPNVQYIVPTGNFGDVLAGYYAQRMGLPIHKLIIATNENDILHRFMKTGTYEKCDRKTNLETVTYHTFNIEYKEHVKMTPSPAMDILVSSNFERFMYYILCGDSTSANPNPNHDDEDKASTKLSDYMAQLKSIGGFTVSEDVLMRAKKVYSSYRVSNQETLDCVARYYHHGYAFEDVKKHQYILDPHTAVGIVSAERLLETQDPDSMITVCLATASPGKFPEHVLSAINRCEHVKESTGKGFQTVIFSDIAGSVLLGLAALPKRCWSVTTGGKKETGALHVRSILECNAKKFD